MKIKQFLGLKLKIYSSIVMKIYFIFFIIIAATPKYRTLPEVTQKVIQIETLPDYFGFDVEDFDGVQLE